MQVWLLLLTNRVLRLVNIAPDKGFPCNNLSEGASLSEILRFQEKKKWVTAEVLIHPQSICMMVEGHLQEEVKNNWCAICVLLNRTSLEASLKLYKFKISHSLSSVIFEYICVSTDTQIQNTLLMTLEN